MQRGLSAAWQRLQQSGSVPKTNSALRDWQVVRQAPRVIVQWWPQPRVGQPHRPHEFQSRAPGPGCGLECRMGFAQWHAETAHALWARPSAPTHFAHRLIDRTRSPAEHRRQMLQCFFVPSAARQSDRAGQSSPRHRGLCAPVPDAQNSRAAPCDSSPSPQLRPRAPARCRRTAAGCLRQK